MRELRGFTLIELLVAMGVFTLLGFGATALLLSALTSWRLAESRRDAAERAELVFEALAEDLACLAGDATRAAGTAVLLSDYDAAGRQRLALTRSVPPPAADPRIAAAGRAMTARDDIDGVGDLDNLKRGTLRSPGDLMTVRYVSGPDERLYRAAATPELPYAALRGKEGPAGAQLLAEGVMHVEYNFWSKLTGAWRPPEKVAGPAYSWDSTGGLVRGEAAAGEGATRTTTAEKPGSLEDPRDDRFPRLVEVRLVLSMQHRGASGYLADRVSADQTSLDVENAAAYPGGEGEHFVKIDDEWISYGDVSRDGASLKGVVRGRRGTAPAAHASGAVVRHGQTFRLVVRPHYQVEPWEVRR